MINCSNSDWNDCLQSHILSCIPIAAIFYIYVSMLLYACLKWCQPTHGVLYDWITTNDYIADQNKYLAKSVNFNSHEIIFSILYCIRAFNAAFQSYYRSWAYLFHPTLGAESDNTNDILIVTVTTKQKTF